MVVDPISGETVSRWTVHTLKERLREVTAELELLKRKPGDSGSKTSLPQQAPALAAAQSRYSKVLLMKDDDIAQLTLGPEPELPERAQMEEFVVEFFTQANIQIPILHRDYFLWTYFRPLYGEIGSGLWKKLLSDNCNEYNYKEPAVTSPLPHAALQKARFFVFIIAAILTSQLQHRYPLTVLNMYKVRACRYVDAVWNAADENENGLAKYEMLQSLLLLTQYSLMRPTNPGAWYLVGTSAKLCQDLGLHNESAFLFTSDYFLVDMRRRLFWCCYCLDRQISIYFGRPFGLDNRQIDAPLLTARDDLQLKFGDLNQLELHHWMTSEPTTKNVSIHFINLRVLQGEIFDYMNDTANRVQENAQESPRFDKWKVEKHQELINWLSEVPREDFHQFFRMVFALNFNQTLILLYGVSAITPVITNRDHYKILYAAGREIVQTYTKLIQLKRVNYSWVAIHYLNMGATAYLSLILQCPDVMMLADSYEVRHECNSIIADFEEFSRVSYEPAKAYANKFRDIAASVMAELKKSSDSHTVSGISSISSVSSPHSVGPFPEGPLSAVPHDDMLDDELLINSVMGSVNRQATDFDFEVPQYAGDQHHRLP